MIPLVDATLAASALRDVGAWVVFVLFVLSAFVLTIVILLQEGKGGGLGSAFGGAAADTFGVKAGTVNKFTAYLAAAFLGLALLYGGLKASSDEGSIESTPKPEMTDTGSGNEGAPEQAPGEGDDEPAPPGDAPAPPGDAPAPPGDAPAPPGDAPEGGTEGEGGGSADE